MAHIIIIDDDLALRTALAKHLQRAGHQVRLAGDGDAGVRAFRQEPADVVLVDIFMPVRGGLATIEQLRREHPNAKIVAMSGVTSAVGLSVQQHAAALGADRFIGKPFEAAELVKLVEGLLGTSRAGA